MYLLRGADMRLEKLDIKDFVTQHYLEDYLHEHKTDHLPQAIHVLKEFQVKLSTNVMISEKFDIALLAEIHRLKYLICEAHTKQTCK